MMLFFTLVTSLLLGSASALSRSCSTSKAALRVETFVHPDVALNMVSSLIIGSEAAVLVDLPLTISSAKKLVAWIKTSTDKPIVAAFTSHNHPDHYLSARTVLDAFPNATFYASAETAGGIKTSAPATSTYWSSILGSSEVVQNTTIPTAFPYSFFSLPGDSEQPIYLIQPLTGDTIDETLFWLPSIHTLITGDTVFGNTLHLFMADMLTSELTTSWISTLDFLSSLEPAVVVPGHSLTNGSFEGTTDIASTREYLAFWKREVEAKGPDYYTPQELYDVLDARFPGRHDPTSELLLNITVENFGRGGARFPHVEDLTVYTNEDELDGWEL